MQALLCGNGWPPVNNQAEESEPKTIRETTPTMGSDFHVLQTVLDLSKSVAALNQRIDHLAEGTQENSEKLEKIDREIWGAKVGFVVAVAIISGVVALAGWLISPAIRLLPTLMSGQ